jgi:hypothetical protein
LLLLIAAMCVLPARPLFAQAPTNTWAGAYYANRDLQGAPALVRNDPELRFNWGGASPGPGVPGSNWSARWERAMNFTAGDYTFTLQMDDGARLYLDGRLVVNAWQEGALRTVQGTARGVSAGWHTITVEYFQATGDSALAVRADRGAAVAPPAAPTAVPPVTSFPEWRGEYFNDINLAGAPLLVRNDPTLDFSWSLGSPDPRVPPDNFSVRWTRSVDFAETDDYLFQARTSDGVRLWLDGKLVIDEWHDTPEGQFVTYSNRFYDLDDGNHTVTVEYYERGGIAYATVWWNQFGSNEPEE